MIDLHTHSTASDGSLSPAVLVETAAQNGLSAIALTDHDTVNGVLEAGEAAKNVGIKFIPGIEIEIAFNPGEFHLLGLDLNNIQPELIDATKRLEQAREQRNHEIVEKLQKEGLDISYEELLESAGTEVLGRPHIANLLTKKKLVRNKQDAFDKYLAKGKTCYLRKACLELDEAINLIHNSGGLAFIAHPMSLFVSWTRLHTLVAQWKEQGIDGLEAWHPCARLIECKRLDALGKENNLRVSAGSDFHCPGRPDRVLGHTVANREISEDFLEAIKR